MEWRMYSMVEVSPHGPPEFPKTDQGSQITGSIRIIRSTEAGVRMPLDRRRCDPDNIPIERLFGSLKQEATCLEEIKARSALKNRMTFCNSKRPRSALDRQTPNWFSSCLWGLVILINCRTPFSTQGTRTSCARSAPPLSMR